MPTPQFVARVLRVEDALDTLPLFSSLSEGTRRRLLAAGTQRCYGVGATLFQARHDATGPFIVLSGRVRVTRVSHGRQHVVHTEGPGGTLAKVPLFEGGTLPATAEAVEPTRCLVLHGDALRAIMREDPDVALLFLRRLSSRVRELVDRLDRATGQPVLSRVAAFLLVRASAVPDESFTLGMTQGELAEELGTVREVIVRTLAHLRESRANESAGSRRFRVCDRAALTDVASRAG